MIPSHPTLTATTHTDNEGFWRPAVLDGNGRLFVFEKAYLTEDAAYKVALYHTQWAVTSAQAYLSTLSLTYVPYPNAAD